MAKKVFTAEELEIKRIKKNEALKKWRHSHKEQVAAYMQQWHAEKKQKEENLKLLAAK